MAVLDQPELPVTPSDVVLLLYSMARLGRPQLAFIQRFSEALLAEESRGGAGNGNGIGNDAAGLPPQVPAQQMVAALTAGVEGVTHGQAPVQQQQQQPEQQPEQQQQWQQQHLEQRQQGELPNRDQPAAPMAAAAAASLGSLGLSVQHFTTKDLCLIAWSLGQLGLASPPLLHRIADVVAARGLSAESVQSMCNLLQPMAAAGVVHEGLPDAVAAELLRRPAWQLKEQDVCNLAHSFAVLWQRQLEAAGHFKENRLSWARTVSGHVRARPQRARLLGLLSGRALALAPRMQSLAVASCVWAMATLGQRERARLLDALAARAIQVSAQLEPHAVSQIAWSFSALSFDCPELMEALAEAATRLLASPAGRAGFGAQAVSMLALAYATLNRAQSAPSRRMLAALGERALEILPEFTTQGLSNLAWGLAAAAFYPAPLLRAWRSAAGARAQEFTEVELSQLHLVEVALQLEAPEVCAAADAGAPLDYRAFFESLMHTGRLRGVALRSWSVVRLLLPHVALPV